MELNELNGRLLFSVVHIEIKKETNNYKCSKLTFKDISALIYLMQTPTRISFIPSLTYHFIFQMCKTFGK